MKKKQALAFLAVCGLTCGTLFSCRDRVIPSSMTEDQQQIYGVYLLAQQSGYTGTYDEWLASIKGADGASVLTGAGVPADTLGADGDTYIDTSSYDFYTKTSGAWGKKGNIKGATGAAGAKGDKGDTGDDGEDGASILSGSGIPAETLGSNGDTYLDVATGDIYKKTDGAWAKTGSITGATGETGSKGDKGDTGAAGATAYSNTILEAKNGNVMVDVGSAVVGADVTFTFTPDTLFLVDHAVINGATVPLSDMVQVGTTDAYTYTAKMVANGFVVEGVFVKDWSKGWVAVYNVTQKKGYVDSDLQTAINDTASGDVLCLTDDIITTSTYPTATYMKYKIARDKKFTIDLHGHTITDSFSGGTSAAYWCALIQNSGDLTINDSVGGRLIFGNYDLNIGYGDKCMTTIYSPAIYTSAADTVTTPPSITLNGGTIKAPTRIDGIIDALDIDSGNVNIHGGTISGGRYGIRLLNQANFDPTLTMNGGLIKSYRGIYAQGYVLTSYPNVDRIIINDGTVYGTDAAVQLWSGGNKTTNTKYSADIHHTFDIYGGTLYEPNSPVGEDADSRKATSIDPVYYENQDTMNCAVNYILTDHRT